MLTVLHLHAFNEPRSWPGQTLIGEECEFIVGARRSRQAVNRAVGELESSGLIAISKKRSKRGGFNVYRLLKGRLAGRARSFAFSDYSHESGAVSPGQLLSPSSSIAPGEPRSSSVASRCSDFPGGGCSESPDLATGREPEP